MDTKVSCVYRAAVGEVAAFASLAFSVLALASAAFCLLRGAPAQLDARSREAFSIAHDTALKFQSFEASAQSILGAVQEERERAIRAQRRASADRVKIEGAEGNSGGGGTRDEQLASLRKSAGLI